MINRNKIEEISLPCCVTLLTLLRPYSALHQNGAKLKLKAKD